MIKKTKAHAEKILRVEVAEEPADFVGSRQAASRLAGPPYAGSCSP